ncbi:MAG: hypothetical protein F4Y06_00460 [Rhodospirillales bacterium]|nr:hypothetical protein [Rhodospirillales bacterium]
MTVQHMIETFLAEYPATISAVSAIATVSAVIAALYLARKQSRPRLQIFADINVYISSESQIDSSNFELGNAPRMIGVTINNVGPVTVSISYWSSFIWSVWGGKERAMLNPAEPDFRSEPIVLQPGNSASIVLSFDLPAQAEMMKKLAASSRLGAWSLRFPRLTLRTEIGDCFRARLGSSLRSHLQTPST